MRNLLFLLSFIIPVTALFGQTETVQWQGETYFVYPHQSTLLENSGNTLKLFAKKQEILKRDDKNRNVIGKTIEPVSSEYSEYYKKDKDLLNMITVLKKLVRENPNDFYAYNGILENGITPALESIPDGKYVQFYKDVAYLDGEILRYKNDIVAAVFTVKNGDPDGTALYYDIQGKEIARGNYSNGSRNGEWKSLSVRTDYGRKGKKITSYEALMADKFIDTIRETITYADGLKNGLYLNLINNDTLTKGLFKNDEQSGTWSEWQYQIFSLGNSEYDVTKNLVLKLRYTVAENPVPGKSVIIREEFLLPEFYEGYITGVYSGENNYEGTFEFPKDPLFVPGINAFSEFYKINYSSEKDEDIELPEEDINSFEGEDYSDYELGGEFDFNESDTRNKLIDSLGYVFSYTGIYEGYYPNGQLQFRFEIIDGQLQKEEPFYWDNGVVANSVEFNADSNYYELNFFDYNGNRYATEYYDSKGNPLDTSDYDGFFDYDNIVGTPPGYNDVNELDVYINKEGLKAPVSEKRILKQKTWKKSGEPAYLETYDPAEKTLEATTTAISGKVINKSTVIFAEDFSSVNGAEDFMLGSLRLHRQMNGSVSEGGYFYDEDFLLDTTLADEQKYVNNWFYHYDTDYDNVLFCNDQPFTGKYEIKLAEKKYRLKSTSSSVSFSIPEDETEILYKASAKFAKKGKKSPVLDFVSSENVEDVINSAVLQFTRFADYDIISMIEDGDYEYDDYGNELKRDKSLPYLKTVSGSMLNGKPQGLWTGKDQNGKILVEITFENGEENGVLKVSKTAYAPTKKEIALMKSYQGEAYDQSFETDSPKKNTRYLAEVTTFRNGMFSGPRLTYNWKGDTMSYVFYRDGIMQGYAFERNKYIYAQTNYEDDALDGIAKTWLTIPGRDSVLLYDLNFQNGALQGESKSYHANGKLAKRGFFLYGQPIEDYEAFDTLGFKYQYVKFKYSQPVEEKIWEENELSLRYEFDWRDSIPFDIRDIAKSPSVEELTLELGLGGEEYYEPYLGRPSLVDKTGIDYYMTKYYPNDTIAREGFISKGKKSACWKYYSYSGKLLYEVDYADTTITLNDSIKFKSKGILSFLDDKGLATSHSYIIEKFEKYDCSHTDHYEQRMLYCFWEKDSSMHRRNGYTVNYYDNGAKMAEGTVKNGLPDGVWKMYDNSGNLNKVGEYKMGKRQGRWLSGDLTNVKFLGDICLNPNLPNLEEIMKYQEKLIDITVIYYKNGKVLRSEYYGINMNSGEAPEGIYGGDY